MERFSTQGGAHARIDREQPKSGPHQPPWNEARLLTWQPPLMSYAALHYARASRIPRVNASSALQLNHRLSAGAPVSFNRQRHRHDVDDSSDSLTARSRRDPCSSGSPGLGEISEAVMSDQYPEEWESICFKAVNDP